MIERRRNRSGIQPSQLSENVKGTRSESTGKRSVNPDYNMQIEDLLLFDMVNIYIKEEEAAAEEAET